MSAPTAPTNGRLVCVVGPSGAGKDTVLNWLTEHWPGPTPLYRARRCITRPADAGGEWHEALEVSEFERLRVQGLFAWHWCAHGLHYGVRQSELQGLAQGACVLVNGSRAHLDAACARYPGLAVLHITASEATLTQRLLARQRETASDIAQRVRRSQLIPALTHPLSLTIHNDGSLTEAGQQALDWLQAL